MELEVERVIAVGHPSVEGHFPGNPLVPGVVILDEVARAVIEALGAHRLTGIPGVKFLAPLRPGQVFAVRFTVVAARQVKFRCLHDEQLIAQGLLEIM